MSLTWRILTLQALALLLSLLGSVGISLWSASSYLETQLSQKNQDAALSLALVLAQPSTERSEGELILQRLHDSGSYAELKLLDATGQVLFSRRTIQEPVLAPHWFVTLLSIRPLPGQAKTPPKWHDVASVVLNSRLDYAYDMLWRGTIAMVAMQVAVSLAAGAVVLGNIRSLLRPLQAVKRQAVALMARRFVTLPLSDLPEARDMTQVMNTMVERMQDIFESQSTEVEALRRKSQCDSVTGLANREHFLSRLRVSLTDELTASSGVLMMVRFQGLNDVNLRVGHTSVDKMLCVVAKQIGDLCATINGSHVGRLNGADLAVMLPGVASKDMRLQKLADAIRVALEDVDVQARAMAGAACWRHGEDAGVVLARTDQVLTLAETRGNLALVWDDMENGVDRMGALGDDAWRRGIDEALSLYRVRLAEYRVVHREGHLVHLECPVRMQLSAEGHWLPASQWLPMAQRVGRIAQIDLLAIELALEAIAQDGVPRAVNLSPLSLQYPGLLDKLQRLLAHANGGAAGKLGLELPEHCIAAQLTAIQDLSALVQPYGVALGIEHAGLSRLDIGRWMLLGLRYVKLDAALVDRVSEDHASLSHLQMLTTMLQGIGVEVYAEGVANGMDMNAIWSAGLDGVTGPVVAETENVARNTPL